MRLRDLGPLLIENGGRDQPVAGTKGPAMLARLTIDVNQQVSVDALTEAAWGDATGAATTLPSHIWRLRQLLEPDRGKGEPPRVLLNDGDGYRLVGSPSTIDSLFVADTAGRVRDLLAGGQLEEALGWVDEALSCWRGRPYGPAADATWAQPAVARLDELRMTLQERRISALIGLGALDIALSDVRPLIAALPFHESLRALHMQALHLSGRTEQALEAFQEARRTLINEVGIEPGRDLQILHRRILDDDPTLDRPRPVVTPLVSAPPPVTEPQPRGVSPAGVHLPPMMTALVGRDEELSQLQRLVHHHHVVTISGPAGVGKTRLAVEVARALADDFADGVWFVDLVGVTDPTLVVDFTISTMGFLPSSDGTPLEDLQTYLAERKVLVVLDNCEHLLTAVVPLVEAVSADFSDDSGSRILTTSRERLSVVGEVGWTLEPLGLPETALEIDDPPESAAVRLLLERLRAADPTLTLDAEAMSHVVRICAALDGLPLPIELAAARAPAFSLAQIADQVSVNPERLRRPGSVKHDHRATLHSTIEWSYRLLEEREREAHRRLSVLPGPFTDSAAAAVLDADPADVQDILLELVHRSMLARVGHETSRRHTLFRQLVTVRGHAQRALLGSDAMPAFEDRRDAFTADLIGRRPPLGTPDESAWYDALDDDQAAVRATLTRRLITQPAATGALLTTPLGFYWYYRGRLVEALRWHMLSHELLLDGDPPDLALVRLITASNLTLQGRHAQARPFVDAALNCVAAPGGRHGEALVENLIGLVGAAYIAANHRLVVELHQHLLRWVEGLNSDRLHLLVDAVGTNALAVSGQLARAAARSNEISQRATRLNVPMAIWLAAGAPMAAALLSGHPEDGIPWAERCMETHFASGTGAGGAFIETRGNFAAQQGDDLLAARLYGAAHATTRRVGMRWPWRDLTLELIARTRTRLGDTEFERRWRAGQTLTPLQVLDGLRHGWSQ